MATRPIGRIPIHLLILLKTPRQGETKQILNPSSDDDEVNLKILLLLAAASDERRRRLLDAPLRHPDENRGAAEPPEPPGGVVGVPIVERRAPAAEGVDAASPVGEAVQAREGRRQGELGQGSRFVSERSRSWIHARDGWRGACVLGEGGEGEGGGVV